MASSLTKVDIGCLVNKITTVSAIIDEEKTMVSLDLLLHYLDLIENKPVISSDLIVKWLEPLSHALKNKTTVSPVPSATVELIPDDESSHNHSRNMDDEVISSDEVLKHLRTLSDIIEVVYPMSSDQIIDRMESLLVVLKNRTIFSPDPFAKVELVPYDTLHSVETIKSAFFLSDMQ
jgi:hypothetical protein